jgi:transcriptional regulator with XRE-family HTH domain
MIGDFIKKMRNKMGYTQEFLAKEMGLSRPTLVEIEQNQRDLTVPEAKKLADIFNLSLDDLLCERDTSAKVTFQKSSKKKEAKTEMRINIPQEKRDKFKEVLLYILSKVGAKPNIGQTVIYKLLYFIDFDYYEKYEEQLIGAKYIKNHYGPTPIEFAKIVEQMEKADEISKIKDKYFKYSQTKYLPVREPDLSKLTGRELEHIKKTLARLADKNANELTELSHSDIPWIGTKDMQPIEYEAVFYRTPKTSVRMCDDKD